MAEERRDKSGVPPWAVGLFALIMTAEGVLQQLGIHGGRAWPNLIGGAILLVLAIYVWRKDLRKKSATQEEPR